MFEGRIRIITTGGTFDKLYDAVKGELTFSESQLPRILNQARVTLPVHLDTLLAVDSLVMTEEQRKAVVEDALSCIEKRVVIIHGTDTMTRTAQMLKDSLNDSDEHVFVFTGAMIPYALENYLLFPKKLFINAIQQIRKPVLLLFNLISLFLPLLYILLFLVFLAD